MATSVTYNVGITGDTMKLQQAIAQAQQSLQNIASMDYAEIGITSQIREAALAASELQQHLTSAINTDTGKLDLTKFQSSLAAGGVSLEEYAAKLKALGPTGENAFIQVATAISQAQVPIARTSALFDKLWISMKNTMRWQISSMVFRTLISGVTTAYSYAQDLNESLTSIQIVTQKSAEEMSELAVQANKAASALSTTTTDYTDASLIYYQQGLSDEEVEERTNATIKFANVTAQSASTASDELTAIWNNFADGSETLEYYVDVITALGATTASSSTEIAEGIQKFAAIGETVGLSYEYAASALATVVATTRQSADTVGTAFKTLFARIQDLELGETLEDGVDLGTYSQALDKIGVSILDESNNLRDMDDILDDTAAKWDTLTSAQQTSLAQTVAGVRQYTQFMALMENWDAMQANLNTAYGSEGTLDEQADIYAQSWEAARAEVKNAAEDIYDSIINEDFFISFDQKLASVLHRIASVVDALGGMGGVILTLVTAVTSFSTVQDKMAQGLRNLAYNFTYANGEAQKAQQTFQQGAADLALQMASTTTGVTGQKASQALINAEDVQMQTEINNLAKNLTEEQVAQLTLVKSKATAVKETTLSYQEEASAAEAESKSLSQAVTAAGTLQWIGAELSNQEPLTGMLEQTQALAGDYPNFSQIVTTENGQIVNSAENCLQAYTQLSTVSGKLTRLREQLQSINTDTKNGQEQAELLRASFEEITGVQLTGTLDQQLNTVGKAINDVDSILKSMNDNFSKSGVVTQEEAIRLSQLQASCSAAGAAMQNYTLSVAQNAKAVFELKLKEIEALTVQKDWASQIVATGNYMMQLGMILNSVKSLKSVWNNDDLDRGEKIIQTLTTLGIIIPIVVKGMKTLTNSIVAQRVDFGRLITAQEEETLASLTTSAGKKIETEVVNGNTVAVISNTKAWYKSPLFVIAIALAAVAAIIAGITSEIEKQNQAIIDSAEATLEENEAKQELVKTNRELITTMQTALETYAESGDNKSELDDATIALAEAYGVEGSALAKLTGEYENYNTVLREAKEAASIELVEAQTSNAEAIEASLDDIVASARKGLGYVQGNTYTVGFSGLSQGIQDIIKENVDEQYINLARTAQSANSTRLMEFDIDITNKEELVNFYKELQKSYNEAIEKDPTNEALSNMKDWLDKISDLVDEYDELIDQQELYNLQLNSETNPELITSLEEYDKWVERVTEACEKNGDTQEQIDAIIQNLVDGSLNSGIQGWKDLSDAIKEAQNKLVSVKNIPTARLADNSDIDNRSPKEREYTSTLQEAKDYISKVFQDDNYDNTILASLNYGLLDSADAIEQAYQEAKAYADALDEVEKSTEAVTAAQSALKTITSSGTLSEDGLTSLYEDLDWGEGEAGVEAFSNFLKMSAAEQQAYLQQIINSGYTQTVEGLRTEISTAETEIAAANERLSQVNDGDLQEAYDTVEAYNQLQAIWKDWQVAKDEDMSEEDFQAKYEQLFAEMQAAAGRANIEINWDDFKDMTADEVAEAIEEGSGEAQVLINAVDMEEDAIEQFQEEINDAKYEIEIQAKLNFDNSIDYIKNSGDNIISIFNAIEDGYTYTLDSAGNAVHAFSIEAVEAIEEIVPGFAAAMEPLEDGTLALTDEMYQAFFDSSTGSLQAYTESYVAMLEADNVMLESERTKMETLLQYGEALATGQKQISDLSNQERIELMGDLEDAQALSNGELLGDEVETLTDMNTNWSTVFGNMSTMSEQAATDSSTNIANATGSILKNLEKIRSGAYTAYLAVGAIGSDSAAEDVIKASIDTSVDRMTGSGSNTVGEGLSLDELKTDLIGDADESYPTWYLDYLRNSDQDYYKNKLLNVSTVDDSKSVEVGENMIKYAEAGKEAIAAQESANNIAMAKIQAAMTEAINKASGNSTNDDGGTVEKLKELEEFKERYHEINNEISYQKSLIKSVGTEIDRAYGVDKLSKYTKKLEALNKQQDLYNQKLDEIDYNLSYDEATLKSLSLTPIINSETKDLENYSELLKKAVDDKNSVYTKYNEWLTQYNTLSKSEQENQSTAKEQWETMLEEADDLYDKRKEALDQYEETADLWQETSDLIVENLQTIEDTKLDKLAYVIELKTDIKEAEDNARDLAKTYEETFGDALSQNKKISIIDQNQANADMEILKEYQTQLEEYQKMLDSATDATSRSDIIEKMQELQDNIQSATEDLLEYFESLKTYFSDALEAMEERFKTFTDQLSKNTSVLDTLKEIYALQGITSKTAANFAKLQELTTAKMDAQIASAKAYKQQYEYNKEQLELAEEALLAANETDANYDALKANRDALLESYNNSLSSMLSSAKDALTSLQTWYDDAISKSLADFEDAMTNGLGFDLLQEEYDNYIDEEERYLDAVNEAYEVSAWYNKLQADIDKTGNELYKSQLEALQAQIDARRENNTLSEYDLEILQAQYDVLQAQMELEDAQNNKTQLRLTRDSQGNWSYQYTSDAGTVQDAENNLLKAQNDWYNKAKSQLKDISSQSISATQTFYKTVQEALNTYADDDEKCTAAIEEARRHYYETMEYLEEEKNVAIADMNDAANASLLTNAILTGDSIADVTGITSQDIQDIVEKTGISTNALLTADSETLKKLFADNSSAVYQFSNEYAQDLGAMTEKTEDYKDKTETFLGNIQSNWEAYKSKLSEVSSATGVSTTEMTGYLNDVEQATSAISTAADETIPKLQALLTPLREIAETSAEIAENFKDMAGTGVSLSTSVAESINKAANTQISSTTSSGYTSGIDYSDLIKYGIKTGLITIGDSTYEALMSQRQAKIDATENFSGTSNADFEAALKAYNNDYSSLSIAGTGYSATTQGANEWLATVKKLTDTASDIISSDKGLTTISEETDDISDLIEYAIKYARIAYGDSAYKELMQLRKDKIKALGLTDDTSEKDKYFKSLGLMTGISGDALQKGDSAMDALLKKYGITGFDTGGYTGDFQDGKLAVLHEKELVLNQEDTANILTAVSAIRTLGPEIFTLIDKVLDSNISSLYGTLSAKLDTSTQVAPAADTLEQNIHIDKVEFPNVTSSDEIEQAFANLANDASQWIRRKQS